MNNLVIFASFTVLCSSNSIPTEPGDNSHYIQGKSRYIWMTDGEDIPRLVDLFDKPDLKMFTRDNCDNQYWLYTRFNPKHEQIITYGDEDSISKSNYNGSKPLKVIVHGWSNNGSSNVNKQVKSAFLTVLDTNVIVVDWRHLASSNYVTATNGVPSVGEHLGAFLIWLLATAGGDWNNVHLVGFSLGAHVVGVAGRTVGGRSARVSALDPAGPLWVGNPQALNTSSGQYVETIHTDGGFLGMSEAVSHGDFFPNHGQHPQPGCMLSTCSHSHSYYLYASSVYTDHFEGRKCNDTNEAHRSLCTGSKFKMGNGIITKRGSGIYGLITGSEWPF